MAIIDNNDITSTFRGKVGPWVFRRVGGKTIVCRKARPNKTEQTLQQKETRDKFRAASRFAKDALKNPELRKRYEAMAKDGELPNAYTAAVGDFLKPVQIVAIYTAKNGAKSRIGSLLSEISKIGKVRLTIVIKVNDPLKVRMVEVSVSNRKGHIFEAGEAVLEKTESTFRFAATLRQSQLAGATVKVRATGISGATSVQELLL